MSEPKLRLATAAKIESIDAERFTVRALVSTGDLVRDHAIVLPSAWQRRIQFYQENPVLLWCHPWSDDASDKAPWVVIGKAIEIEVQPDGLYCTFQYAVNENPQAKLVFDLVSGGYLRAFSVGFYPYRSIKRFSSESEKAALPEYARAALESGECTEVFTDVELWEISQVWIGSDRRALAQAVRDGRVDDELAARAFRGDNAMETQKTSEQQAVSRMAVPFMDVAARLHNLASLLEHAEYEGDSLSETIASCLNVLDDVSDVLSSMLLENGAEEPVSPLVEKEDEADAEDVSSAAIGLAADDTEDSFTPPQAVREAAELGLELRRQFKRGGTEIGVARARDLKNGKAISRKTIARMVSYFARHAVDAQADGWEDRENPSAGWIAWLLWGGDAGRKWSNDVWSDIKAVSSDVPVNGLSRVGRPISRSRMEKLAEALMLSEQGNEIIRTMLSEIEKDDEEVPQGYAVEQKTSTVDVSDSILRALRVIAKRNENKG